MKNASRSILQTEKKWSQSIVRAVPGFQAGCLVIFSLVFLVAGSAVLYFFGYRTYRDFLAAKSWTETPCTIVSSRLVTSHGENDTYSPHIVFQYEWQGQPRESERYQLVAYSSSFRSAHQRIVDAHPPGLQTVCYVNPNDPSEAVLDRSFPAGIWIGAIVGGAFALFGIGGLVGSLAYARSVRRRATEMPSTPGTGSPISQAARSGSAPPGTAAPQRLAPQTGRKTAFFWMLLFGVFWNGIVSVFVGILINSFRAGDPQWFMALFLTPFVLIGLVLIVAILLTFLAMFNPVPQLTLLSSPCRLGGPLSLTWEFSGGTSRIRKLTLSLVGEESATYRHGTSTMTDTSRFHQQILTETTRPTDMVSGRIDTALPERSMHSWKASNNKIEWTVTVHGEIPFFPDINDKFPVEVLPAELWVEA